MILKLTLYFLILFSLSLIPYQEKYYTFFTPFYDKSMKTLDNDKHNYIHKTLNFGSLHEYNKYTNFLSKTIIKDTKILNINITKHFDETKFIDNLDNYRLDLIIIPRPLIYNYYNKYKKVRFVTNLNSSTFFMIYNSNNIIIKNNDLNIKDLDKNSIIGVSTTNSTNKTITSNIITNIFNDDRFKYKYDSLKNLTHNIFDDNNEVNVITFIDSNPSKILTQILDKDIKNKIKIMSIKQSDMNFDSDQTVYLQDFVKFKNYSQLNQYNTHETIYFFNVLLSNNNVSPDIIYNILKLLNRDNIDEYLPGNNINDIYINRLPGVIVSHKGVDQFYGNKQQNV
jgi:TRAP-type uncharacterized transport system substrate-binding protein